ncbi:hypothetical protein EDB87DRAFT_1339056 [Lactarius vividus]|nr:hypothetical protein EDB87DRAFT_1339056 [Lactarius vividus]
MTLTLSACSHARLIFRACAGIDAPAPCACSRAQNATGFRTRSCSLRRRVRSRTLTVLADTHSSTTFLRRQPARVLPTFARPHFVDVPPAAHDVRSAPDVDVRTCRRLLGALANTTAGLEILELSLEGISDELLAGSHFKRCTSQSDIAERAPPAGLSAGRGCEGGRRPIASRAVDTPSSGVSITLHRVSFGRSVGTGAERVGMCELSS